MLERLGIKERMWALTKLTSLQSPPPFLLSPSRFDPKRARSIHVLLQTSEIEDAKLDKYDEREFWFSRGRGLDFVTSAEEANPY